MKHFMYTVLDSFQINRTFNKTNIPFHYLLWSECLPECLEFREPLGGSRCLRFKMSKTFRCAKTKFEANKATLKFLQFENLCVCLSGRKGGNPPNISSGATAL